MWWPNYHPNLHRGARFALALTLAGLVAGCFQPLYASRSSGTNAAVLEQLRAVDVRPVANIPNGTPESRIAVEVRNALLFELTGGGEQNPPTHRLLMYMGMVNQQLIVDITTSRPDVSQAGISMYFTLIEIASGRTVVTGSTFSRVSYDNPGQEQRFARARGRIDAETRAARVIAEDIRSRLASYFIAGT